jgi:hypothetical protein
VPEFQYLGSCFAVFIRIRVAIAASAASQAADSAGGANLALIRNGGHSGG